MLDNSVQQSIVGIMFYQQFGDFSLSKDICWLYTIESVNQRLPFSFIKPLQSSVYEAQYSSFMHWMVHIPQAQMTNQKDDKISWDCGFSKRRKKSKEMIEVIQHVKRLVLLNILLIAFDQHLDHSSFTQVIERNSYLIFFTSQVYKKVEKSRLMIYSCNIEEYAFDDNFPDDLRVVASGDSHHDYSIEFRYSGVIWYGDIQECTHDAFIGNDTPEALFSIIFLGRSFLIDDDSQYIKYSLNFIAISGCVVFFLGKLLQEFSDFGFEL